MPTPADPRTQELIDTFNITRHAAECAQTNLVYKGRYTEPDWIKALDRHNRAWHDLHDRLAETGPVETEGGHVWSAEGLERAAQERYEATQQDSHDEVVRQVKELKDELRSRYDDEKLKALYRLIDRL